MAGYPPPFPPAPPNGALYVQAGSYVSQQQQQQQQHQQSRGGVGATAYPSAHDSSVNVQRMPSNRVTYLSDPYLTSSHAHRASYPGVGGSASGGTAQQQTYPAYYTRSFQVQQPIFTQTPAPAPASYPAGVLGYGPMPVSIPSPYGQYLPPQPPAMTPQFHMSSAATVNPYMPLNPGYSAATYGSAYSPAVYGAPPPLQPGMGVMDPYGNYLPPNVAASLARGYFDGFDAYRGRDHHAHSGRQSRRHGRHSRSRSVGSSRSSNDRKSKRHGDSKRLKDTLVGAVSGVLLDQGLERFKHRNDSKGQHSSAKSDHEHGSNK